jgi:prolyl 4-hydroxylase
MVSVENGQLRGGGSRLKQQIWAAARETIEEWTGQELTQCSLYGIRIYTEGSVLATHVDRLPLVSSAIINVAQDVDEPWPIEVYGHDGKATNVTMEPGDMVLYESHSVLHGRPFPLKGRYYANIFIHFEPVGHTLRHNDKTAGIQDKNQVATARRASGHEVDQGESDLPPYIIPGTPEESNWRRYHPSGKRSEQRSFTTGSTSIHLAAQNGDLETIKRAVAKDKSVLSQTDSNGWTPLHEASRAGHKEIVKFLYESGADINARTNNGDGGTAIWWAKKSLGEDHEIISYLESLGGIEAGPDL